MNELDPPRTRYPLRASPDGAFKAAEIIDRFLTLLGKLSETDREDLFDLVREAIERRYCIACGAETSGQECWCLAGPEPEVGGDD